MESHIVNAMHGSKSGMAHNAGRIGKVRMKATGFEFRVIHGPPDPDNDIGATMIRHARGIAQWPDMTGSIVIGVFRDGTSAVDMREQVVGG